MIALAVIAAWWALLIGYGVVLCKSAAEPEATR